MKRLLNQLSKYLTAGALLLAAGLEGGTASLEANFVDPPPAARPGVYWYFMDGNQDREEMIADLDAMQEVGLGSVLFLEVNLKQPIGPVPFMSETWQDNVAHAFVHAGELGMEVLLGVGPGWTGSGGSWVDVDDSMQHLVGSRTEVSGPGTFNQLLPVPEPHARVSFAGMNPAHKAARDRWYEDVAVLAFPSPKGELAQIDEVAMKTLEQMAPYTIRWGNSDKRFVMPQAVYPEPEPQQVIAADRMIDLSDQLNAEGRLEWEVPPGEWTIIRFVARSTGQTTRPAPRSGHGFESNKFDAESYRRHWNEYQAKLIERIEAEGGPLQPGRGLTTIHLDSWEMGSQNWTEDFRAAFREQRGYDPRPYYPAWMGWVVGSREKTERFLWDMRKTAQELVLEEYAGTIKEIAHDNGLLYSNQPYDMNPAGDIDLGSVADIPMCEFWNQGHNSQYSCIEAVSIANTMGSQIVKAEGFTSSSAAFQRSPASMKNHTDWAFAMGINGILFHTYQHQALGNKEKPGMTMWRYGIHWHRNQTFWDYTLGYHRYIARCSQLLRQGEAVVDILYLTPEGAPFIFEAPEDATEGPRLMRDKRGYAFDAVSPRILSMRASVEDGRIAFRDGSQYRVLVLPDLPTMTPETLAKIEELIAAGATVIGNPPIKSPSLVGYPEVDERVAKLSAKLWGGHMVPTVRSRIDYGHGRIYWGGDFDSKGGRELYPSYAATAKLLSELGLPEDFSSPSGKLRYKHRSTATEEIYFVSNRTAQPVVTEGSFRVTGLVPQLWDPVTAERTPIHGYTESDGVITLPLSFAPSQSFFVIFEPAPATSPAQVPAHPLRKHEALSGAWQVSFDPRWGGPEDAVTFDELQDWTTRPEAGIRYYSGTATYRKRFDVSEETLRGASRCALDLGRVQDICRVRLNGKDLGIVWTAPWQVDVKGILRAKGNELEIEVVNRWANRLIGDQQPDNKDVRQVSWPSGLLGGQSFPAGRYTFVTYNLFGAQSPLLPAGLIGPVSIFSDSPDTIPPKMIRYAPKGEVDWWPQALEIEFDEPVLPGKGWIEIMDQTGAIRAKIQVSDASHVTVEKEHLRIMPPETLPAGGAYTVLVRKGAVADHSGNSFEEIPNAASWGISTHHAKGVLVLDGFSGEPNPGNGNMVGRQPDRFNAISQSYTEQQYQNVQARMEIDADVGNPAPSLKTGFGSGAHIRFSEEDALTKPVTLALDIQINTQQDDADPRGVGLGFWSTLPTLFPQEQRAVLEHFTGILVNPAGQLEYIQAGQSQGVFVSQAPPSFSSKAFLKLQYSVDPLRKQVTQLTYGGIDYTDALVKKFGNNFVPAPTAGFFGTTGVKASFFARVDNFVIAR